MRSFYDELLCVQLHVVFKIVILYESLIMCSNINWNYKHRH